MSIIIVCCAIMKKRLLYIMNKRLVILFIMLTILLSSLFCQTFEFKYKPGMRYRMLTQIAEDVFVDGEYSHTSRIVLKEGLNIIDYKNDFFVVSGNYIVSEDSSALGLSYSQKREYKDNFYKITSMGKFADDQGNFMPVKRNSPLFKSDDIKRGESWFGLSYEMHDFRDEFGIDYPYKVPSANSYTYEGIESIDGVKYHKISTRVSISHNPNPMPARYQLYPVHVSGYSQQLMLWDSEKGTIFRINETFDVSFELSDGQVYRYKGESISNFEKMEPIPEDEYNRLIEKMFKLFGDDGSISRNNDWVRITFNDINFGPDDYILSDLERSKLKFIADEVANHRGRYIKIVGHTAFAGSQVGRMNLSQTRAEVVRDFLIESNAVDPKFITANGKGASERIDYSGSKSGMMKNRRVDIYILVN